MTYPTRTRAGFSLVELSIVLVILGLLVGGVLSGQSLIRAAELRSVTTQYQQYSTAIGSFKDKYFALPGDMSNAGSFWGTGTCSNGDGDGMVDGSTTAASNETHCFWYHMAMATMVEGSYAPASWAAGVAGTTHPKAKLNSAGWNMRWAGTVAIDDISVGTTGAATNRLFEGDYGNVFILMSGASIAAAGPSGGVLKAEEAWNVDTKMDDGKPQLGSVTALESQSAAAGSGCGLGAAATTATAVAAYDLTNTSTTACSLVFKSGY